MQTEEQAYREGKISIIEGPQRSGKTLAMSILAYDEFIVNHSKILTNIAFDNPVTKQNRIPYEPLNFFKLTMEGITEYTNSVITIDELNFFLDSRGSMTKVNRKFCQWLLQSKKMGINTYGTTHQLGYLDLRFRENFDFLIRPICYYNINNPDEEARKRPIALRMKFYNGPTQKHFRRTITIDFRKMPKLLGLYNTRNVFDVFGEMEEQMALEKKMSKIKTREVARAGKPVYSGRDALSKIVPDYIPPTIDSQMPSFLNGV